MSNADATNKISAIRVHQWLSEWDEIDWQPDENRKEPPKEFYLFSIRASHLKALSGVYQRTTDRERSASDLGIQRRHDTERSKEINRFIKYGYPCSTLSERKRDTGEFNDLRQPGWLPTAIIVNILNPDDERNGKIIGKSDLITIEEHEHSTAHIVLPEEFKDKGWNYESVPPIEVIDGQHRLWAFDEEMLESESQGDNFEVPVVAFRGLDLSWQAYLFYTINIKPKKINTSLAYDLYPLLRTESWLEKSEGHKVYQETRAQELVDLLWSYPKSPWHHRINMLGDLGKKGFMVTQAAWIRSLMASFIRARGAQIGGLYGSEIDQGRVLSWDFHQQAAFLILAGSKLKEAIGATEEDWAIALRERYSKEHEEGRDPAFYGKDNLLNQDQGIRALLQTINDMVFIGHEKERFSLFDVRFDFYADDPASDKVISDAIEELNRQSDLSTYLESLCESLAAYDWRAANALSQEDERHTEKLTFRGSGGYKSFRIHLLRFLKESSGHTISEDADIVFERLGYASV